MPLVRALLGRSTHTKLVGPMMYNSLGLFYQMRLPSYLTGGINNKTSQTIPHFPNFGQIPFQESIDKF